MLAYEFNQWLRDIEEGIQRETEISKNIIISGDMNDWATSITPSVHKEDKPYKARVAAQLRFKYGSTSIIVFLP